MSERGSFATEYIYCGDCLLAVKQVLAPVDKFLWGQQVGSWQEGRLLPIVAGKIGGTYSGEEMEDFEAEIIPALEAAICHPVRMVLFPEASVQCMYRVMPGGGSYVLASQSLTIGAEVAT